MRAIETHTRYEELMYDSKPVLCLGKIYLPSLQSEEHDAKKENEKMREGGDVASFFRQIHL